MSMMDSSGMPVRCSVKGYRSSARFDNRPALICLFVVFLVATLNWSGRADPQETFARAEFAARRAKLLARIRDGIAVIPAATPSHAPVRFRQAPDFWYLTGIEQANAVLVLDGRTSRSYLFVEKRHPGQIMMEGPGILESGITAAEYGLTKIAPLSGLAANIKALGTTSKKLYIPLSPQDTVQAGRMEVVGSDAELLAHPLYTGIRTAREIHKEGPGLGAQEGALRRSRHP